MAHTKHTAKQAYMCIPSLAQAMNRFFCRLNFFAVLIVDFFLVLHFVVVLSSLQSMFEAQLSTYRTMLEYMKCLCVYCIRTFKTKRQGHSNWK